MVYIVCQMKNTDIAKLMSPRVVSLRKTVLRLLGSHQDVLLDMARMPEAHHVGCAEGWRKPLAEHDDEQHHGVKLRWTPEDPRY